MKKMTLISASVALVLAGCSDDDQTTQANTIKITAFDGYFHNAVVFNDTNKNGVLDINSDTIFGLTDIKGQISIPDNQSGFLALQTLTLGGPVQTTLVLSEPETYRGIYTVDSDHPDQPVSNELVLRSPATADVISPITDLVAIEMGKSTENAPITEEQAIAIVNQNLGLDESSSVTVYSNFVEDSATNDEAAELHKTAQILTVTKGETSQDEYEQKSDTIAKEAAKAVDAIAADPSQDIRDPDLKPIIDPDGILTPVSNYVVVVDEEKAQNIKNIITEPYLVGNTLTLELNIEDLFTDKDVISADVAVMISDDSKAEFLSMGIDASVSANFQKLLLTSSEIIREGTVKLTLVSSDLDSNGTVTANKQSVSFTFKANPVAPNEKPTFDGDILSYINAEVANWVIKEDVQFSDSVNIGGLFTDPEGDPITYDFAFRNGIGLSASINGDIVTVSGVPENIVEDRKEAFYIYAWDNQHTQSDSEAVKVEVKLPEIEFTPVTIPNDLIGKDLFFVEVETEGGRYYPDGLAYCSVLRLADGVAYIRDGQDYEFKQECPVLADEVVLGEYTISENGTITILEGSEGKQYEISMRLAQAFNQDNSSDILFGQIYRVETLDKDVGSDEAAAPGAMEIFTNINDVKYFIYSNSPCTAKDPMCQGRYSKHIMPSLHNEPMTAAPLEFGLGTVGYSMVKESDITFDADINFDLMMGDKVMTCDTLTSIYGGSYFFTIEKADGITETLIADPNDCFENSEGASIDFDITGNIEDDTIVSFTALPNIDYRDTLPRLTVNMQWTGQGNND